MIRLASIFVAAFSVALPAHAQNACPERDLVTDYLASEFEETPIAMGMANNGGVIEVYSSVDRTTWTIMITMPDGTSCMIAAGQAWEALPMLAPVTVDPEA